MKTFALAATVAAGLMLTAGSADAQFRYRNSQYSGSIYNYPSYVAPSTFYSTPAYNSGVVTSNFLPGYGGSVVVPASGYSTYYAPTYTPTYTYTYPSYGTYQYNGGVYRGRGWRW